LDNLTHSLFGLTLARTPLGRAGRGTTPALLLASNIPDVDIVVTAGGAAKYLQFHRGVTHGPLGVLGLSLAVAALVWLARRRWDRASTDPPARFLMLWAVAAVGIVCHVLMDLPTSYGTRALSPFSWTWYAVDWMPIVDLYLIAGLGGALWLARGGDEATRVERRRRYAAIALLLTAGVYGVRAASHHLALARAPQVFGTRLPGWCERSVQPGPALEHWPRLSGSAPADRSGPTRCLIELAAMPNFISPFRWRLIAQITGGYEVRDVDLLTGRGLPRGDTLPTRSLSVRVPNQWTPAVKRAAQSPLAQVFLGFSRFPAARSFIAEDGTATVRWTDMRFITGALEDPRQFRRGLFGATVIVGPDGAIREARLGP
jgi:membrane-bound metal-dependent hydrolase YbcI (DUF457 family)